MMETVDRQRLCQLRLEGARRVMEEEDLDVLVATTHDNVRYLTDRRGFFVYGWEPNAMAILGREGEPHLLQPDDYVAPGPHWADKGRLLREKMGWDYYTIFNPTLVADMYAQWAKNTLKKMGIKKGRLGLDRTPWQLRDALKEELDGFKIENAEEGLLFERAVKNEEEIKIMRHAAMVASAGVEAGLDALAAGKTEYEIYGAFMGKLYELGSEGDGFYPFLASGPFSEGALYPVNRKLQPGDPVIMDMGPIIDGYNGDCMRTGFIGEPTPAFKELYKTVYDCMYAGVNAVRPGVKTSEVDAAVRKVIRDRGYLDYHFDSGHGLGLNCCELPIVMRRETYPKAGKKDIALQAGMTFTLEPRLFKDLGNGTYIQCALEESLLVTPTGVEVMTNARYIDPLIR